MPSDSRVVAFRFLLVAGLCCLAVACGRNGASAGGAGSVAATVVTTEQVGLQPWSDTISALGTVKARESVTVTAKVSEIVDRVHFDSGDEVAAGAILVTLSGKQQQAALAAAEAEAKEAEQQYRRGSELVQQQLIARSQLDTQRATRDAAAARVAQMRADIGDRSIRAPFAGVLGFRQVSPGALVTPGTALATLDDISRVYVDFQVPELHLAQLAQGQSISGTSAAWPGQSFEGTVSSIDARIDPGTRSITVRGDFPNPGHRLRPGMLVQVRLVRGSGEAVVVPEIAVQQLGSETFAWRVKDDGTVEKAAVVVGGRVPGRAMIADGLAPGDRIVVEGVGKLQAGARISEGGAAAE